MAYGNSTKRPQNPNQRANFCSKITFFYALKTIWKGFHKQFTEDDVYETLDEHKSEYLENAIAKLWNDNNASKFRGRKSLHLTVMKMFSKEFIFTGLSLGVLCLIIRPIQATSLANLTINFVNTSDENSTYIITNAVLLSSSSFLSVIVFHPTTMQLMNIGLKIKIACSSLIHSKMLKLSLAASQNTSVGQILNLLTSDVNILDKHTLTLHYLWIGPLQVLLYAYLMFESVGLSSLFGILFLLILVPVYLVVGHYSSKFYKKASLKRDQRLQLTNEVMNGMTLIKMQSWEKLFSQLVSTIRKDELKHMRSSLYLKGLLHLQAIFSSVPLFITMLFQVLVNNAINAEKLFFLANLYNSLGYTMATLFPQGIIAMHEAITTFKRVETFLLLEEVFKLSEIKTHRKTTAVIFNNVTVQWPNNIVLKNVNLNFPEKDLSVIIGPVGSGKSTLLQSILNEINIKSGSVTVNGTISYSSQEPWIFPGTFEDNILFGSAMIVDRYKTVIKVCALDKDLAMLPDGDKSLVGENGALLSGGQKARLNLARAIYKNADIYLLDDPLSAVDIIVADTIFHECLQKFLKNKTVILVTHQLQLLQNVNYAVAVSDRRAVIEKHVKRIDYWDVSKNIMQSGTVRKPIINPHHDRLEITSKGSIKWSVYKYYFQFCDEYFLRFVAIMLFVVSQTCLSATSYFMKYWVNLEQDRIAVQKRFELFVIYFVLTVAAVMFVTSRMIFFYRLSILSSKNLHDTIFGCIMQAQMQFFNENSSGRILNRFSKDINIIDESLPNSIFVMIQNLLSISGSIALISLIKPWFIIPSVTVGMIFYLLNSRYLPSSVRLKRLETSTKSPMFEHVLSFFQGLPTVRAFRSENIVKIYFNRHQDLHSCTHHLTLSTSRAFGFWLDIVCVCYIIAITLTVVISKNERYGGTVGLLLTQAVQLLGTFQLATKQCAEIENNMTSVERLREYSFIEHEDKYNQILKKSWPEKGEIQFQNVYLKYPLQTSYALKNINLTLRPQEKIGIVGRTGSGKSSLVTTLFRLTEIKGAITIDNVNIKNIKLTTLRSKLLIIPQNPLLFSGTIRKNLDVFDQHRDEVLWQVLEDVNLKHVFCDLTLDTEIFESGNKLSTGQKQLLYLARAILSKKKILILDEATASIDLETDAIIQKILKQKFFDCTVLTIAHRLFTVMDSDRILVMKDGSVVNFDHPHILIQNKTEPFYSMVHQTDKATSKMLIEIAENHYKKKFDVHLD